MIRSVVPALVAITIAGCGAQGTAGDQALTAKASSTEPAPSTPVASSVPAASFRPTDARPSEPAATPYPHSVVKGPQAAGMPVVAAGGVWVPGFEQGSVMRIDPDTAAMIASIDMSGRPSEYGLVADGTDLWVPVGDCATADPYSCTDGWLARIDTNSNDIVETVPVGTWGYASAIHDGTMWMTSFLDRKVLRIDLASRDVVAEVPVADPTGIVAAEDGVWTPIHFTGRVARIDPTTNEAITFDTGTQATEFIALTEDVVWVTAGENSHEVTLVSRATNEVIERIEAGWPQGIVVEGRTVWVAATGSDEPGYGGALLAIDSATHRVLAEYPLPKLGPGFVAITEGTAWVAADAGFLRMELRDR